MKKIGFLLFFLVMAGCQSTESIHAPDLNDLSSFEFVKTSDGFAMNGIKIGSKMKDIYNHWGEPITSYTDKENHTSFDQWGGESYGSPYLEVLHQNNRVTGIYMTLTKENAYPLIQATEWVNQLEEYKSEVEVNGLEAIEFKTTTHKQALTIIKGQDGKVYVNLNSRP